MLLFATNFSHYCRILQHIKLNIISEHSKKWDEDDAQYELASTYGPHYQKYGKRPCRCPSCSHDFLYECSSVKCSCCATG